LTGKRIFTKGNWDKKTAKSETEALEVGKLKTIETLKRPYNWEFGGGINL
jgi:hypothetical protein